MKTLPVALTRGLPPDAVSIPRRILGLAFLIVCLAASLMLVLQHFGAINLPGFGPHSACAAAVSSRWGILLGWPVSFVGFAYFAALAVAWTFTVGSGVSTLIHATVRLAALASIAHLLILSIERWACIYCVVIHASNLVFWIIVERSQRATESAPAAIGTLLAGFVLVSALLNVAISEQARSAAERAWRDSYRSIDIAENESTSPRAIPNAAALATTVPDPDSNSVLVGAEPKADRDGSRGQASVADQRKGQTFRQPFRSGPDQAKVRLVVFYDYQSAQCWRIERDIQNLMRKYGDKMSVTARHYPLCSDCNVSLNSNSHRNACRAALAAEAAGVLKGRDGFWQMHRWLLQRRGNFTDDELKQGLVELGYDDAVQFLATMNSPRVLGGVLADIVEAQSLQIHGVPTVLFNGRKLAGLQSGTGLVEAMLAVANTEHNSPAVSGQPPAANSPIDLSATDTFSERLQQTALAATVRIVNTAGRSVGSGAIITLRDRFVYVLTAYHIVPEIKRVEVQTYSTKSHPEPAGVYSYATVVAKSESADLAVIRFTTPDPMPEPLPMVPLELVPQNLEPQKSSLSVLTVGYDDPKSAPSCIATEVIDTKRVRRTDGDAAVTVWEVAQESAPGRSGGPLIDQRGFVLGIASGIAEGKGYFTHAEEIHRFLQQNGLQGLLAPTQEVSRRE